MKIILYFLAAVVVVLGGCWVLIVRPCCWSQGEYRPEYPVDAERLKKHVRVLSQEMVPRDSSHVENLQKTADYIRQELAQSSREVRFQTYQVYDKTYHNVIATYGPETEESIVIGAHYDAYSVFPGADDNASAVAGLIELGRLLGKSPPKIRVELVAYTLEEPPFFETDKMGSAVHARSLKEAGRKIRLMICLEMIGYFSDEEGSQDYPLGILKLIYPNRGNFIAVVDQLFSNQAVGVKKAINTSTDLPAWSINAPPFVPGIDLSDHRNFWAEGYPAVMITDTAFFRNRAYHTPEDTWDRLDYEKMAKVVYGLFSYLRTVDG